MNRYHEISRQFYGNRLLFGDPAEDSIVALEIAAPGEAEIFRRRDGVLTRERRPLQLFLLLADRELMKGTRLPHQTIELAGDFPSATWRRSVRWRRWRPPSAICASVSGKTASAADAPYFVLTDAVEQYPDADRDDVFHRALEFRIMRRDPNRYRDLHQQRLRVRLRRARGRPDRRDRNHRLHRFRARARRPSRWTSARCSRSWCESSASATPTLSKAITCSASTSITFEQRARRHKLSSEARPRWQRAAGPRLAPADRRTDDSLPPLRNYGRG